LTNKDSLSENSAPLLSAVLVYTRLYRNVTPENNEGCLYRTTTLGLSINDSITLGEGIKDCVTIVNYFQ